MLTIELETMQLQNLSLLVRMEEEPKEDQLAGL